MSVETFSVTFTDVIAQLPIDGSEVSTTSAPLSTVNVSDFILQGAAEVNTTLGNAGVSASDSVTHQQCRTAVISYGVMMSLQSMGMLGTQAYRDAKEQWDLFYASMRKSNNINAKATDTTLSTSTGKTRTPNFSGSYFRGF
jgi:hypothetical protein